MEGFIRGRCGRKSFFKPRVSKFSIRKVSTVSGKNKQNLNGVNDRLTARSEGRLVRRCLPFNENDRMRRIRDKDDDNVGRFRVKFRKKVKTTNVPTEPNGNKAKSTYEKTTEKLPSFSLSSQPSSTTFRNLQGEFSKAENTAGSEIPNATPETILSSSENASNVLTEGNKLTEVTYRPFNLSMNADMDENFYTDVFELDESANTSPSFTSSISTTSIYDQLIPTVSTSTRLYENTTDDTFDVTSILPNTKIKTNEELISTIVDDNWEDVDNEYVVDDIMKKYGNGTTENIFNLIPSTIITHGSGNWMTTTQAENGGGPKKELGGSENYVVQEDNVEDQFLHFRTATLRTLPAEEDISSECEEYVTIQKMTLEHEAGNRMENLSPSPKRKCFLLSS